MSLQVRPSFLLCFSKKEPNNPQKNSRSHDGHHDAHDARIGWGSPAGVLLFWATSSVFAVAQQQITLSILRRKDREREALEAEVKPVKVDVTRKAKKPRPTKKAK